MVDVATNQTKSKETEDYITVLNVKPTGDKLSDFGILTDLYLSLNYYNVKVPKTGIFAKFKKQTVPLDIDLACAMYDKEGNRVDLVWFKKLRDDSESIIHQGDNLHGYQLLTEKKEHRQAKKEHRPEQKPAFNQLELSPMDLESIHLNLNKLPDEVHQIALIVSSFQNSPLNQVPLGHVELADIEGNFAMRVDLTNIANDCSHLWLASLVRTNELVHYNDIEYQDWRFIKQEKQLVYVEKSDYNQNSIIETLSDGLLTR